MHGIAYVVLPPSQTEKDHSNTVHIQWRDSDIWQRSKFVSVGMYLGLCASNQTRLKLKNLVIPLMDVVRCACVTSGFYRSEAAITKLEREAKIYKWRAFVGIGGEGALANSFVPK